MTPKTRLYSLIVVFILSGLALGGLVAYTILDQPAPIVQPTDQPYVPVPTTNTNTNTSTVQLLSSDVTWNTPVKISSLHVFPPVTQSSDYTYDPEKTAEYYRVGLINNGLYKGANIIIVVVPPEGLGGNIYNHFLEQDGKITILDDHSDYFNSMFENTFDMKKVAVDHQIILPDLKPQEIIKGPKPRQILELNPYSMKMFQPTDLQIVFSDPIAGPIYTNIIGTNPFPPQMGPSSNGFYIKMPDGTSYAYKLKIDFINEQNIPAITWTDGSINTTAYESTDRGGCGSSNYAAVISPSDISITKDLTKVGINSFGDTIYALKDTNHKLLKDFYNTTYQIYGEDQQKISYEEFIKAHPLIFWIDPFQRLIKLSSYAFQPMAECGKPVIYLYPPKTTNVSVQVKPEGGLSYSDPAYNTGWQVTAEPNGQLTNLADGQTYPYLFWEGRGGLYEKPTKGWVIDRAEVNQFLREQLQVQGLVGQEIEDFMEFWLPRMQAKPYYFISFYGTRVMDQLAPLTIEPKPDTVIRLLMDFTPLDQPISVKPYAMPKAPTREGFTVIEWGGVIQ